MKKFTRWNSQPLDAWAQRYAEGSTVDLAGHRMLGKLGILPVVGEVMYCLQSDFVRRMALKTTWFHNKQHDNYFENATRFHKVAASTNVMLSILRTQFFHTLTGEVHAELSSSHFEVFDNVGHCPHDESSDRFNPLALEFLS